MGKFSNKVALVSGSSQGIGKGIALCLAEEGADLVINFRSNSAAAHETAEEIKALGRKALIFQADVSDREQIRNMFKAAEDEFGRIDIVVANAAYSVREKVVDAEWKNVLTTIKASQFGVFHTCQFAAQHMVKQPLVGSSRGKILIISSILAEIPPAENAAYNMSKTAINALGETMAAELAADRINVNIINPGLIDTPGERQFASDQEIEARGKTIPWQRLGTIRDIGNAAVYLASDDADYVTGATLRVDGGFLLGLQLPPIIE